MWRFCIFLENSKIDIFPKIDQNLAISRAWFTFFLHFIRQILKSKKIISGEKSPFTFMTPTPSYSYTLKMFKLHKTDVLKKYGYYSWSWNFWLFTKYGNFWPKMEKIRSFLDADLFNFMWSFNLLMKSCCLIYYVPFRSK